MLANGTDNPLPFWSLEPRPAFAGGTRYQSFISDPHPELSSIWRIVKLFANWGVLDKLLCT